MAVDLINEGMAGPVMDIPRIFDDLGRPDGYRIRRWSVAGIRQPTSFGRGESIAATPGN